MSAANFRERIILIVLREFIGKLWDAESDPDCSLRMHITALQLMVRDVAYRWSEAVVRFYNNLDRLSANVYRVPVVQIFVSRAFCSRNFCELSVLHVGYFFFFFLVRKLSEMNYFIFNFQFKFQTFEIAHEL